MATATAHDGEDDAIIFSRSALHFQVLFFPLDPTSSCVVIELFLRIRPSISSSEGMAQFVCKFAEPGDPEYAPPVQEAETPQIRFHSFIFSIWSDRKYHESTTSSAQSYAKNIGLCGERVGALSIVTSKKKHL